MSPLMYIGMALLGASLILVMLLRVDGHPWKKVLPSVGLLVLAGAVIGIIALRLHRLD